MDAAEGMLLAPEPSVLTSIIDIFSDPSALLLVFATMLGFVLPMLWVYPPVAPRPSDFLNETHSKLGLGTGKLASDDATGKAPSSSGAAEKLGAATDGKKAPGRIDSLWVYPVKSCPGIQVSRSRVLPTGIEFDRLFTFAQLRSPFPAQAGAVVRGSGKGSDKETEKEADNDGLTWDAITQRQFPMLASLQVELWRPDVAKVRRAQANMRADYRAERNDSMSELYIVVRYPWQAAGWPGRWDRFAAKLMRGWRAEPEVEVVLPLAQPQAAKDAKAPTTAAKCARVRLSDRTARAFDLSAELPRSLQLYLGVSNRLGLFRFDTEQVQDKMHNPVFLMNTDSVAADTPAVTTSKKTPKSVEQRLRANVVVNGIATDDEYTWEQVSFKPPPASKSLLDEAVFQVRQQEGHEISRGIQLTPVFGALDKPDLMELTLETGMSVHVLQRKP